MCIIYAVYKNIPNDEELERGAWQNDDGAGIAWLDRKKNTVRWVKGLSSKVDDIHKAIKDEGIVPPYGIHFRTASIGGTIGELTHPFPICKAVPTWEAGSAPLVLMHNGHINNWKEWLLPMVLSHKDPMPLPPWSDSRALALAVHIKGEGILDFIIQGSRVMILDYQPSEGCDAKEPESYFRLYGHWHHNKEEGYYQSIETKHISRGKGRGNSTVGTHACGRDTTVTTGTKSGLTCDAVAITTEKMNVWTIEELETLANDIRKEQEDATLIVGV